jgi:hypothetical protein
MIGQKVYCINCKYHLDVRGHVGYGYQPCIPHICKVRSKVEKDAIGVERFRIMMDCEQWNIDNDCRFYKRIWYKFWVK